MAKFDCLLCLGGPRSLPLHTAAWVKHGPGREYLASANYAKQRAWPGQESLVPEDGRERRRGLKSWGSEGGACRCCWVTSSAPRTSICFLAPPPGALLSNCSHSTAAPTTPGKGTLGDQHSLSAHFKGTASQDRPGAGSHSSGTVQLVVPMGLPSQPATSLPCIRGEIPPSCFPTATDQKQRVAWLIRCKAC